MFTNNESKAILKLLISQGISLKLHNEIPVIYSKKKVDPELLRIAKKYREGIARILIDEKKSVYKNIKSLKILKKNFTK